MHRQPEHVMAFLLAELGTSGSLDGQQRLVVKGRFAPKVFEGILRHYVSKFTATSSPLPYLPCADHCCYYPLLFLFFFLVIAFSLGSHGCVSAIEPKRC
jgi:hypothetical protein